MALYPKNDTDLKRYLLEKQYVTACKDIPEAHCSSLTCEECEVNRIIEYLDAKGYHVGLPESIEYALNSGDGVYRP